MTESVLLQRLSWAGTETLIVYSRAFWPWATPAWGKPVAPPPGAQGTRSLCHLSRRQGDWERTLWKATYQLQKISTPPSIKPGSGQIAIKRYICYTLTHPTALPSPHPKLLSCPCSLNGVEVSNKYQRYMVEKWRNFQPLSGCPLHRCSASSHTLCPHNILGQEGSWGNSWMAIISLSHHLICFCGLFWARYFRFLIKSLLLCC